MSSLNTMARTEHEDIAAAQAEWHEAQARANDARARLIAAVRRASESGTGERILAEQAGVTRQTIRQWIGRKPS
jgi:ABC-type phosphate transport system substrate-binding protein